MDIFPIASEARSASRDTTLIFNEIRTIEEAILQAITNDEFSIEVSSTIMTARSDSNIEQAKMYYSVWQDTLNQYDQSLGNPVLKDQMNQVQLYFKDKQYTIYRKTNGVSTTQYTFTGLTLTANANTDVVTWSSGSVTRTYENQTQTKNFTGDSFQWLENTTYIYYDWVDNDIKATTSFNATVGPDNFVVGIYEGDGNLQVGSNQYPIDNYTFKWVINW